MGIMNKIKDSIQKSGSNKGKLFYVREGEKKRVRFLSDIDEGLEIVFHDSFEKGINQPCGEMFGKSCDLCDTEGLRTRSQFAWPVWDYDAKEVKVFMYAVNNCSPVPALVALNDTYQTLLDRDYIISTTGKQQNKSFSVIPMDKAKFRNEKARPLSNKAMLQIIDKAFPRKNDDDFEEEFKSDEDYENMMPKELYKICKEKGIEVSTGKSKKYYILQLEEFDKQQSDWDEESDDAWNEEESDEDDWEDEDDDAIDYYEMSPKELFELCKERGIKVKPKLDKDDYIEKLEAQEYEE